MAIQINCFSCGNTMTFEGVPSRRDECSKCGADVLVCKNCDFYDPKVYNECRETQADPVREKDRSNFCGFYKPSTRGVQAKTVQDFRSAAEALFKKK